MCFPQTNRKGGRKGKENIKSVTSYLQQLAKNIDSLSDAEKRQLLLKVVSKVVVTWNPERKRHGFKVLMKFGFPKETFTHTSTFVNATLDI